ncbi:GMC oxidoreductase [Pseudoruegeria sp. SK021]|uniref:GMC oxidoreductase n=1 Tax=Pseudoruegeria sp. SK021 TaxID=1933035 RepID=UPI000A241CFF|nr:GMC oxidoreductase [Pseudoruegeria sp. SK021]OSP55075.1 hypothetical protein BV911_09655 [Pseudoruegeria sp. SK021]
MDLVLGSGPSGVAVATALLARGRAVTMLDCGARLPHNATHQRDVLAQYAPLDWEPSWIAAYQKPQFFGAAGHVRRFGSDFAMEPEKATFSEGGDPIGLRASRAAGGLSNLWGAAMLPSRHSDISDWPISSVALAPHYRSISDIVPMSGTSDALARLFPSVDMTGIGQIPPTTQAETLLRRLSRHRDWMERQGTTVGAARQAVETGCQRCGMCLHGCPWGHIYTSCQTLERLKQTPGFAYRSGPAVAAISETLQGVNVFLSTGESISGTRVFVATGVLETARIILASEFGNFRELTLKDSQNAFLPMLTRWRADRRPDHPPCTTLPQVFLELEGTVPSKRSVHAQIYTWNEFYARDLTANYGAYLPAAFLQHLSLRLLVAQIFLHSDHSGRIHLSRTREGRLLARVSPAKETPFFLKSAASRIAKVMSKAGISALTFARRDGAPGSSFHVGGSLPMDTSPNHQQTDTLGRPHGLERVHVVDASVLPSIPATTITLTVMANAHRIGSLAP